MTSNIEVQSSPGPGVRVQRAIDHSLWTGYYFEPGQYQSKVLVESVRPRFPESLSGQPLKANHHHIILPEGDQECKTGT